ncbi:Uncharacterised protein [Vibrio cholerae]|nr:Uncharacterised protein [Vibrio cholerae]
MPIPVSRTINCRSITSSRSARISTLTSILPRSVNLMELPTKLVKTC